MTAVRRRFQALHVDPADVHGLKPDHAAIAERRTLFPTTVVAPNLSPRLLVSGLHSRKLGSHVAKGLWRGFPIFYLTLEERSTCPRSCLHYTTCMGNAMPLARRHAHGDELIERLWEELAELQVKHCRGFVVRLHQLGDFFSVDYVAFWRKALARFPAAHVFGYTAWQIDTPIGRAVARLRDRHWNRFAVRTSDGLVAPNARTIWHNPENGRVAGAIVCPAQTGATQACGTCALCWAAPNKTIVFIAHGMPRPRRNKLNAADSAARHARMIELWNAGHHTFQDIADELGLARNTVADVLSPAIKDGRAVKRGYGWRKTPIEQVSA